MTLKQIAEELGVSYFTVSRVVNGCTKNFSVKPEVRAMILGKCGNITSAPIRFGGDEAYQAPEA